MLVNLKRSGDLVWKMAGAGPPEGAADLVRGVRLGQALQPRNVVHPELLVQSTC